MAWSWAWRRDWWHSLHTGGLPPRTGRNFTSHCWPHPSHFPVKQSLPSSRWFPEGTQPFRVGAFWKPPPPPPRPPPPRGPPPVGLRSRLRRSSPGGGPGGRGGLWLPPPRLFRRGRPPSGLPSAIASSIDASIASAIVHARSRVGRARKYPGLWRSPLPRLARRNVPPHRVILRAREKKLTRAIRANQV